MKPTLGKISRPLMLLTFLAWAPSAHSQVLWNHEDPPQPSFISEAVLNGREASSLNEAELAKIRAAIHERVALYSARRPCGAQVNFDPDPSSGVRWRSLKEKLQYGWLVLLGEVVELRPGWQPWPGQVVTLVRLRVLEVMSGSSSQREGTIVSYIQGFGDLQLDGEKICTMPFPADHVAKLGDEIVVAAASTGHGDIGLLHSDPATDLYPIRNGAAQVLRHPEEEPGEFPLETLRGLSRAKRTPQ